MERSTIDIADMASRLSEMTIFDLRNEWRRLHRMSPPMRLSRDLLIRGILYQAQERAYGGLPKSLLRKLMEGVEESPALGSPASSDRKRTGPVVVKPGTRLVREWGGVTHMILVHEDGVEWRGRRYRSLSAVAREITGAHWSGPRFFGLQRARSVTRSTNDGASGESHGPE